MKDYVGEPLDLQLIRVAIGTERPVILAVACREAFDLAGLLVPGQVGSSGHAAVLTEDLDPLLEVPTRGHDEGEVAQAAVPEVRRDRPGVGVERMQEARAHPRDLAAQEARRIYQVAPVRPHEVARFVGFHVARRALRPRAHEQGGLEVVGHGVAVDGVAVPGVEDCELPNLFSDEPRGEGEARIEPLVVPHLEHQVCLSQAAAQVLTFLHGDAHRFFYQDVLTGCDGFEGKWHMELVGGGHDDGLHPGVVQHRVVVGVYDARIVDRRRLGE